MKERWFAVGSAVYSEREQGEPYVVCTTDGFVERFKSDSIPCEEIARLIAAAPELLETVIAYRLHHKLMLNVTDDVDCPCKICQMAEDVIRKAES